MIQHETQVRVRYAETDQMGVVYHSHFIVYFEVARAAMIRDLGLTYAQMEKQGVIMPVTEVQVKYRRPARYDELLTLKSYIREKPGRRLSVETEVYNAGGDHLVTGTVTLAFLDKASGRPIEAPEAFMSLVDQHWKVPN